MNPPCTRMYTLPSFEATPLGAAPGPRLTPGPVFVTSGDVITEYKWASVRQVPRALPSLEVEVLEGVGAPAEAARVLVGLVERVEEGHVRLVQRPRALRRMRHGV